MLKWPCSFRIRFFCVNMTLYQIDIIIITWKALFISLFRAISRHHASTLAALNAKPFRLAPVLKVLSKSNIILSFNWQYIRFLKCNGACKWHERFIFMLSHWYPFEFDTTNWTESDELGKISTAPVTWKRWRIHSIDIWVCSSDLVAIPADTCTLG